jgi:hypothetical protein
MGKNGIGAQISTRKHLLISTPGRGRRCLIVPGKGVSLLTCTAAHITRRHFEAWFSLLPPGHHTCRAHGHNHPPVTIVGPMPGRRHHSGPLHPNGQVQDGWHCSNRCRLPRLGPQGLRLLGQQLEILVVRSDRSTLSHAEGAPGRGRQASLSSPPLSNTSLTWRPSFQMVFLSPVGGNSYSFSPLLVIHPQLGVQEALFDSGAGVILGDVLTISAIHCRLSRNNAPTTRQ